MGILVKFTAECDKCHARKPIEEVYAYNIKLPKGWISTYENGVLCEACKEDNVEITTSNCLVFRENATTAVK